LCVSGDHRVRKKAELTSVRDLGDLVRLETIPVHVSQRNEGRSLDVTSLPALVGACLDELIKS
jgi:hypothetical protein